MFLITLFYTKYNCFCFESTPENSKMLVNTEAHVAFLQIFSWAYSCQSLSYYVLLGTEIKLELSSFSMEFNKDQSMEVSEINFIDLVTKSKRIHTIALRFWCHLVF